MKKKIIEILIGIYWLFIVFCTINTLTNLFSIFTNSDFFKIIAFLIGISIPILCLAYIANEESKQKDERDRIIAGEIDKIYNLLTDEQKAEYKKIVYKEANEEKMKKWNEYIQNNNN